MALRTIFPLAYCIFFLFSANNHNVVEGMIGVSWGRMAFQRLIPSTVVDLLLQNGIHEVKVYSASDNVMQAFSNCPISLTITIPNEELHGITSIAIARDWVKDKITKFVDEGVNIKYVNVGVEPFSPYFWNRTYDNAVDVLSFIQEALNEAGHRKTKATIPHLTDVLNPNHTKPSQAEFRDDIKDKMIKLFGILRANGSPVMVDMLPIFYVADNKLELEFAFVDGNTRHYVKDVNGLIYTNLFDFLFDSFLWAMKKVGTSDVKLIVGQIGWPTDGYPEASIANAERFYKNLLPKVASNIGTPLLPGAYIDTYIHSLLDENHRKLTAGAVQRHWGIYRTDGQPKFKIDLSGQGRDIYPSRARGVTYMPKRWCIFKRHSNSINLTLVKHEFEWACQRADCTSLLPGGSCSHLSFDQNISYAFNSYFQVNSQKVDEEACQFGGLGVVVPDDPSNGTCIFPVEILAAEKMDTGTSNGGNNKQTIQLVKILFFLLLYFIPNNL